MFAMYISADCGFADRDVLMLSPPVPVNNRKIYSRWKLIIDDE
jgi:hypothetical protein